MRNKIATAKTNVKTHLSTHRAKYAFVAGITIGHVATNEVALLRQAKTDVEEVVETVAKVATEV